MSRTASTTGLDLVSPQHAEKAQPITPLAGVYTPSVIQPPPPADPNQVLMRAFQRMLEDTMNPVYKRLDAIEHPLTNAYQPPPNVAKWVEYEDVEDHTPNREMELEYTDLDPKDVAANNAANALSDAEHAHFISEEGQCERAEFEEQARLDHEADVKYWNDIEMEEAMIAWSKGEDTHGDRPSDPITITNIQDSMGTKFTWLTLMANSASHPAPMHQINTLPMVVKGGTSYAQQAAKKAKPTPPPPAVANAVRDIKHYK
jgi:hypothetical protein